MQLKKKHTHTKTRLLPSHMDLIRMHNDVIELKYVTTHCKTYYSQSDLLQNSKEKYGEIRSKF